MCMRTFLKYCKTTHQEKQPRVVQWPDNPASLASLLRQYGKPEAVSIGRCVHVHIAKLGYDKDTFLGNCLIQMYGNCGLMIEAQAVFDKVQYPNKYSWTVLINAYGNFGNSYIAFRVFEAMPLKDVVSWNAIISALVQNGHFKEGLGVYHQMQLENVKPNNTTFVSALAACTNLGSLGEGKEIHAAILHSNCGQDRVVENALVNMYGKCGSVSDANNVFGRMPQRDIASWNAMITVYVQNGLSKEALDSFHCMNPESIEPNCITFACIVDACANLALLEVGMEIHALITGSRSTEDMVVSTALLNMYGECGDVHSAINVFNRMRQRDVVVWNVMMTALSQNGHVKVALDLYRQLQLNGIKPDICTFICSLDACALLASLEKGLDIHASIVDYGYGKDEALGVSLINMYGKCGSLADAGSVFGRVPHGNVVSWNSVISAFAQNGHGTEALSFFKQMQLENVKPDSTTFISLLTACSHAGLVDVGRHFFGAVNKQYGVNYTIDHYVCVIDLLGRAGHLDEAEDLITKLSFEEVAVAWQCLLGACRIHGDAERGLRAIDYRLRLGTEYIFPYIILT